MSEYSGFDTPIIAPVFRVEGVLFYPDLRDFGDFQD